MFQLYKSRNFNAIINDTFGFFKTEGKNYIKNYIIINGGLLLVLAVLAFIIGKVFFENLFFGAAGQDSADMAGEYFSENFGFMVGLGVLTGILILLVTIINYSYPVIYLKLLETNEKPDTKQLISAIKKILGKAVLFSLLSLITFVPLAIPLFAASALMIVLVITIPVAIALFAAYTCWIYLTFYDYLSTDNGYFTSMGNGWKMLFKNFWAHMGSTAIFYVILYIFQMLLMFLGFIIESITGLVDSSTNPLGKMDSAEALSFFGILVLIGFLIYVFVAFIVGNLILVNQGIIYYSCREQQENKSLYKDIDLIGSDVE
ncbi:hypothetical protein AMR72_04855 [Flavobacterium psychrophilum]|nr:hypothetical protein AMR72_04855 [Flavobacterium psychrophilum]AOE51905.1 hypothetical protein ALW18_04850 [Flavobacterium psychrophilum]